MSEDCLYLNVFSPSGNGDHPLPVMFWIHGGGYYLGAGSSFDASELASRGVVVVTINYRLNVFGFLSTGDDVAAGNYGMLDQVMALKWVQQNIQAFGGDPSKVTIFGQSAGASSVSLLTLSPLTAGLFHRAIMESGTSLSPFAVSHDAARIPPKSIAQLIGSRLGCLQKDSKSLIECLRTVDAEKLVNVSNSIGQTSAINIMYSPRVERVYGFLPDHPYSLLRNGKYNDVDCIIGFNRVELPFSDKENKGATYDVFEKMVNADINGDYVISDRQNVYDKIKDVYLQNHTDPYLIREQIQKFRSDFYFTSPSLVEIGLRSRTPQSTKQFLYDFTYYASDYEYPAWSSLMHGAEVPYVFGLDVGNRKRHGYSGTPTSQDRQVAEFVQGAWVNFAKYGNPSKTIPVGNDKWIQFTDAFPSYLNISLPSMMSKFNGQREINLFKDILFRIDTYTSNGS